MERAVLALVWLGQLAAQADATVVCHDQCIGVIGCDKAQEVCEGTYCTFYRHRDLNSPDRVTLKRSCAALPYFKYGEDGQQFGVRNRCIRTVSGNQEWMLQICDTGAYCNAECNSNLNQRRIVPKSAFACTTSLALLTGLTLTRWFYNE